MQKSKINININRDDYNLNDYLYCWSVFGERPNKISLFNHYETESFLDFISKNKITHNGTFTDVVPTGVDFIINEKTIVKVSEGVFISYFHYDKQSDEDIITEVCIFYTNEESDKVNEILSNLDKFQLDLSNEDENQIKNTLTICQNGLEL